MLKSIDNNILPKIFIFLYNFEIFKVNLYSKYFKNIINRKYFQKKVLNRYHPMVFNIIGNYCFKCNLKREMNFRETIMCDHNIFFNNH